MATFADQSRCCGGTVVSFRACIRKGRTRAFKETRAISKEELGRWLEFSVPADAAHSHTFAEWLNNSLPWW